VKGEDHQILMIAADGTGDGPAHWNAESPRRAAGRGRGHCGNDIATAQPR
jgi:hypothetical protein